MVETVFGSLKHWEKGGVQAISANPKHYVFSNVFEVASKSKPYERVAVARNLKYTLEAVRAEGSSPWFTANHDEAAIVMDGEIEIHLVKLDSPAAPPDKEGPMRLAGEPRGKNMGWMKVRRGHMALLPKGTADPEHQRRCHGREVGGDLPDPVTEHSHTVRRTSKELL
jgi:hypothetical protein